MTNNGFMKRLEALSQSINIRQARQIILEVDGNHPDQDEAAEDALLGSLAIQSTDMVIVVRKFGAAEGLPRISSVTPL